MSDVKRLLDEAEAPMPWTLGDERIQAAVAGDRGTWVIFAGEDKRYNVAYAIPSDARLIVHAVNHLPDYEAAVDALQQIVEDGQPYFDDGTPAFHPDYDSIIAGRAALRRLRGET